MLNVVLISVSLIGMGGMGLEEAPTLWGAAVQHNPQFILRLVNGGGWLPEMLEEEVRSRYILIFNVTSYFGRFVRSCWDSGSGN